MIEDTKSITVILELFEDLSLRQILDLGTGIDLDNAIIMLKDISSVIQALHKQSVSHRKLTLDSLRIKQVDNTMKLIVAGFDQAIKLKQPRKRFSSAINLDRVTDFEENKSDSKSTDIQALGKLA